MGTQKIFKKNSDITLENNANIFFSGLFSPLLNQIVIILDCWVVAIKVQAALVIRGGYVPRKYRKYQNRGYQAL